MALTAVTVASLSSIRSALLRAVCLMSNVVLLAVTLLTSLALLAVLG